MIQHSLAVMVGLLAAAGEAPAPPDPPPYLAVVRVSEQLVSAFASADISEQTPVRQEVLGVQATGQAQTAGRVTLDLRSSDQPFCFAIVFEGTTSASTVGRQGPAIIHSDSSTAFTATKIIGFDFVKGFQDSKATISAKTVVRTRSVQSTLRGCAGRLVRKVAWRRVARNAGQVNAIAGRNARQRIAHAFDGEVNRLVERLNAEFQELRPALEPYYQPQHEPVVMIWSDDDYLLVSFGQLQTEYHRPELPAHPNLAPSLIQVWLHGTLLEAQGTQQAEWAALQRQVAQMAAERGILGVRFGSPDGVPGVAAIVDRWAVLSLGEERPPDAP